MHKKTTFVLSAAFAMGLALTVMTFRPAADRACYAEDAHHKTPQAVEDDMHEFMEYVFQPTYKRLRAAMAKEPVNKQGWKAIKSDSLILAEAANLLLIRAPEEGAADWNSQSVRVRDLGGKLYAAAKAGDYNEARQCYGAMLAACNRCHQQFADGKYQLQP